MVYANAGTATYHSEASGNTSGYNALDIRIFSSQEEIQDGEHRWTLTSTDIPHNDIGSLNDFVEVSEKVKSTKSIGWIDARQWRDLIASRITSKTIEYVHRREKTNV